MYGYCPCLCDVIVFVQSDEAERKQDDRKGLSARTETYESELLVRPLQEASWMVAASAGGGCTGPVAPLQGRQGEASGGHRSHATDPGNSKRLQDWDRARIRHWCRGDGALGTAWATRSRCFRMGELWRGLGMGPYER